MSRHEQVILAPVQTVACSQCDAQPGEDCTGPGMGWHLSRWDRLNESKEK